MKDALHIDRDELEHEIARYLAAVDAFRAESCEPTWLPEPSPVPSAIPQHVRESQDGSREAGVR